MQFARVLIQRSSRFVAALVIAIAMPALALDDEGSRAGRVASVQGTLSHKADDAAAWMPVEQNYPVAEGAILALAPGGRAEIDYGGGLFRLDGGTEVRVTRLTDHDFALFVGEGSVVVRVRVHDADDSVRIATPATEIALVRPGLYRIDVAADSPHTSVTVRIGEAELATGAGSVQVLAGQIASLSGVAGESADVRNAPVIDAFDAWSAARDRMYNESRQSAYVSRRMVGADDLAAYGTWQTYPDYGAVWFPADVARDWAPYRFGYWTWLPGWGYAWVDNAAWGYAPFHYGRWAYIGGRWGWCPGAFVARPLWAPALVAWYGGAGFAAGTAPGPIYGWVPLGWREPYVPPFRTCATRCWARYNRPLGVGADRRRDSTPAHFANWNAPGGLTAVSGDALMSGRPVATHRVPVGANPSFTPSLVTRPPVARPVAPVRPDVQDVPSNPPANRATTSNPPANRPMTAPVAPRNVLPARAAPATPRSVSPAPVAPLGGSPRSVLPAPVAPLGDSPRSVSPAPVAPLGGSPRGVLPAPVAPLGGSPRSVLPTPVAPSGGSPRSVLPAPVAPLAPSQVSPTPPAPVPAPAQAVPSVPAPRGAIPPAPPNPGAVER
jgi:Family of unknown function (DUF6600)